jgi:hypothetical protein
MPETTREEQFEERFGSCADGYRGGLRIAVESATAESSRFAPLSIERPQEDERRKRRRSDEGATIYLPHQAGCRRWLSHFVNRLLRTSKLPAMLVALAMNVSRLWMTRTFENPRPSPNAISGAN